MIGLLSNPEIPDSPLIVHRFTVRPFGEKNSPFILNSVVKSNLGRNESLVTAHMQRSVFVNKISGCESEIEANFHFKPGASTVSKWRRNLLRKESSMHLVNLNPWFNMEPCGWYVKYSNSEYSLSSGKNYETRYLKDTALFYDPLAFHSPLATSAKILLQDLCIKGVKLDDQWSDHVKKWIEKVHSILSTTEEEIMSVERSYFATFRDFRLYFRLYFPIKNFMFF